MTHQKQAGYVMATLLVGMSVMAVMLSVAMPVWKQLAQREKEEELIFRGEQYARAIGLFQRKYANAMPPNLDVLVNQRFLRKKFKDPITNDDFVPITLASIGSLAPGAPPQAAAQPGQLATRPPASTPAPTPTTSGPGTTSSAALDAVMGVMSKSKDESIRTYKGRNHYNEWLFVYLTPTRVPGGAPGIPGARGATDATGPAAPRTFLQELRRGERGRASPPGPARPRGSGR
jgi:type II secretory pathway pseudopilin PulG